MVPADYEQCEALFYHETNLLPCYRAPQLQFDFSRETVRRLPPAADLDEAGLDNLLYCRDTPAAMRIADVIAGAAGSR